MLVCCRQFELEQKAAFQELQNRAKSDKRKMIRFHSTFISFFYIEKLCQIFAICKLLMVFIFTFSFNRMSYTVNTIYNREGFFNDTLLQCSERYIASFS